MQTGQALQNEEICVGSWEIRINVLTCYVFKRLEQLNT